jgi:hypothetical protein
MEAPNVTHETDLDPEIFGQEKDNEKWKAIINQLHPNEKLKYSKNIPSFVGYIRGFHTQIVRFRITFLRKFRTLQYFRPFEIESA